MNRQSGEADSAGDDREAEEQIMVDAAAIERAVTRLTWIEQKQFALQLDRFGLTPAQYVVLVNVARRELGCSMGELAERLHQSSATMTGIVDRLVRRGLAERRRDPSDRRLVIVVLTETGEQILARAAEAKRSRTLEILRQLSEAEREQLLALIERYLEHAEHALTAGRSG